MRPETGTLEQVLTAGILAPTADNRPVLKYRVLDDAVELVAVDAGQWAEQPHRRALGLLAAGAMIENIALRSAALGMALQPLLRPDPARRDLLATLRWQAGAPAPDPLNDALNGAIEHRHTNRRFYRRAAVAPAALRQVGVAAEGVDGAALRWLEGSPRQQALRAIRIAEGERFRRRALHEEMFGSIRFDVGWRASAEEGLPPGALEVEPPLRAGFALMRHWPVMRAAHLFGAHRLLGIRAGWLPCATAPRLGLVVAERALADTGWLLAGRVFQRVWLASQGQDLALQPMAAVAALSLQRPGDGWVSAAVQQRLQVATRGFCGPDEQLCMLFRMGQADTPSVVTSRGLLTRYIVAA